MLADFGWLNAVLTIILMTYPWQPFLSINFIVFLAALLLSFYL